MATLIIAQACLVLTSALVANWLGDWLDVAAAFFGGGIAVVNVLLLARRLLSGLRVADQANAAAFQLYFGAIERFVLTIAGFALGLGALGLPAVSMLATFALAQTSYFIAVRSDAALGGGKSSMHSIPISESK